MPRALPEAHALRSPARAVLLLALLVPLARPAFGQGGERGPHALGTIDFPVSCLPAVQPGFNRAVALLHHMTYPEAREAFAQVAAADPRCAMAHWGIAMTLFQPLWPTRPGPQALQRGWDEVRRAVALQPETERERLFVATAEAFFRDPQSGDYWERIRRWEQATGQLYAGFPDDPEVQAFYALALLATAPSDSTAGRNTDRAAEILVRLYRQHPEHPGAMHYLIHANDAPGRERLNLEITRRYQTAAPSNPHALHMPTHIYTRLGDWDAVVRGNRLAAAAALEHPAGDHGEYVWDEYPHAVEYLVYAELQRGRDDSAAAWIGRLGRAPRLEPTFKTAFHLVSTQARYALERRAWGEAARIRPRTPASLDWDRYTWPEAIAWFARGLGAAHGGDSEEAGQCGDRLAALEDRTRSGGEQLFARNIRILRLELDGWRSHAAGQEDSAAVLLRQAAELEAATPKHAVTPGPTLPAAELLGDLLLEQRQPAEALAAYAESLRHYPRRLNSLLGAARAARVLGDPSAGRFYRELAELAGDGARRDVAEEARRAAVELQ